MATLFNTKISATYPGLLKTIDNAALSATLRELTDGAGNLSGLFLNTAGDFKVTNILEWGSLKDTGTGVTITRFVTSTDGLENFDNNTTLPTSAAVKLYVDSKFATSDTLQEVLSFGNTTSGNDIAVSASDDITFTDSSKILMGAGSDLQIYHDGSNSFIKDLGTGNLKIQSDGLGIDLTKGSTEFLAKFIIDGGSELYFNNVKRLETTTDGSKVTGNLVVTGTITGSGGSFLPLAGGTMTGNIVLNDNVKSIYGTAGDGLEIYHDGSDSYINDTGTGSLIIRSADNIKLETNAAELYFQGIKDGAVKLYYDNAERLVTSSTGVDVTGALSTTTNLSVGNNAFFIDDGKALFGAGYDLQIYHDAGGDSYIKELGTGQFYIQAENFRFKSADGASTLITANVGGAVSLYYDNSKKFETVTAGAKVTGNLEVTGTITGAGGSFLPLIGGTMTGDTIHNDNVKSIYGTASDGLEIYHDSANSFIKDTGTGVFNLQGSTQVNIGGANGTIGFQFVEGANTAMRHNNVVKLSTISSGISVTGNVVPTGNVHIQDAGQLQLGTGINGKIYHDGNNFIANNLTGDLYIDQAAVTQSIFFRVSDANALDVTALTINRSGGASFGQNVTIAGDLTVNGTTTTVNSQTLAVVDPLIQLAKDNTANSLDIGLYGDYNDGTDRYLGLFSDASDGNKFKLFKGTTVEPTTTVDIGAAGYVAADLELSSLTALGSTSAPSMFLGGYTYHSGDANTYFGFPANDRFAVSAGGNTNLELVSNGVTLAHTGDAKLVTLSDGVKLLENLYIPEFITHTGDGNTSFGFSSADNFKVTTGGNDNFAVNATTVYLKHTGNSKLTTTTTGVNVTGQIDANTGSILKGSEGLYFSAGGDSANGRELQFTSSNGGSNGSKHQINARSSNGVIALATANVDALTIDNAQNATFAGNITLNGAGDPILDIYRDSSVNHAIRLHSEGTSWIDNNNNFGVGTNNPGAKLEVVSTGAAGKARINSDGNGAVWTSNGDMQFYTNNVAYSTKFYSANKGATLVTIADNGNSTFNGRVGVGGLSTSKFTIEHTGAAPPSTTYGTTEANASLHLSAVGIPIYNHLFMGIGSATYAWIQAQHGNSFMQHLALNPLGGNVGIGTDSPDTNLEVSSATGGVLRLTSTDTTVQTGESIGKIEFKSNDASAGGDNVMGFVSCVATNVGTRYALSFGTGDAAAAEERMRIDNSGTTTITNGTNDNTLLLLNGARGRRLRVQEHNTGNGGIEITSQDTSETGTTNANNRTILLNRSGGNIGVGTYPNANSTLHIANPNADTTRFTISAESNTANFSYIKSVDHTSNTNKMIFGNTYGYNTETDIMTLFNGMVGIGTNSPDSLLNLEGSRNNAILTIGNSTNDSNWTTGDKLGAINFYSADSSGAGSGVKASLSYEVAAGTSSATNAMVFRTAGNSSGTNNTERMRITSGGELLIGTDSNIVGGIGQSGSGLVINSTSQNLGIITSSGNQQAVRFANATTAVGSINLTTTSTSYATSSDYRLKEDLQDFAGLDMVSKIPVYDFKWKIDESRSYGVMAHEIQEVLPDAVTGEKDAEDMQSVDYSKIVPLLVKSIQELTAKVEMLENNCQCKN